MQEAQEARDKNLEVLPAYWGIETTNNRSDQSNPIDDLEVLPAYWGIETCFPPCWVGCVPISLI